MEKLFVKILSKNNSLKIKFILTAVLLIVTGFGMFAQTIQPNSFEESSFSIFSNTLFDTLLCVIIFLLVIIVVLASVLKNVAFATKFKKQSSAKNIIGIISIISLLSFSKNTFAQEAIKTTVAGYGGLESGLFFSLIVFIIFEIIIIWVLINNIQLMLKPEMEEVMVAKKVNEPSFLEKLNASVAIEKEADILLDHNYDGIQELDNDLPPWWKYGFYITIVFAFIYLAKYHVFKTGDLQTAEYNKSIAAAKIAKEEYQKMSANNVNEGNVKVLTDKAEIEKGANVFKDNCVACHGKLGEGGVGPNLTDEYWLHGGSIVDIFKTIKYGWPDKGMKSWQADFSPSQINALASFVKTLKGTNPPNGKAPQGDLYSETITNSTDSTKTDSLKTILNTDSLKVLKK